MTKIKKAQVPMEKSPSVESEELYSNLTNASDAVTALLQHIEQQGKDPQLVDALLYATGNLLQYLETLDEWIGSGKPLHTQMREMNNDVIDVERAAYTLAALTKLSSAGHLLLPASPKGGSK